MNDNFSSFLETCIFFAPTCGIYFFLRSHAYTISSLLLLRRFTYSIWLHEIVNIFLNGRLLSDAEKQTTLYFHLCIIDWQKNPEKINLFYWNEVVRIFIHGRLLHTWSRRKTDDITFPFMYTFSKEKNRRTLFYQLERVFWQLFAVFWRGPTLLEHFLSKREKVKKNRVGRSLAG